MVTTHLFEGFKQRILLRSNFYYKHFNYKNQSEEHYANNKRQLYIVKDQLISVKHYLLFS